MKSFCYVCFDDESIDTPYCEDVCSCKGTTKLHQCCFQKLRDQTKCTICLEKFKNVDHLRTDDILELHKVVEYQYSWKHEYTVDQKGRKQGVYRIYYKGDEKLWEEMTYKNDLLEGTKKVWTYQGKLYKRVRYCNGLPV